MRRLHAAAAAALLALAAGAALAEDETPALKSPGWSFDGIFGTFDRAALQHGFQIYSEVCSNCHSMSLLRYRDLAALGYSDDEIKAIAAQKQVTAGPNDQGEMFQRAAQPADNFVPPFPNEQANRAAHNGALPPDLSLIIKQRDGGADYCYSLLTGFKAAPADFKLGDGMNYDDYFPGHQIAMPQPLQDDSVAYADKAPAPLSQEAHDVCTFLTWASEPTLEARKQTGAKVMLFLLVMSVVLYGAKRKIWAEVHSGHA
ncbi:MAG TPA: cytochrome c1 [Stellaceae bacterium]|nr:cytochrome c1 [Stellaceae bacterium]